MTAYEAVQVATPYFGGGILSIIGFFLLLEVIMFCGVYLYTFLHTQVSFMTVFTISLRLTFIEVPRGVIEGIKVIFKGISEALESTKAKTE